MFCYLEFYIIQQRIFVLYTLQICLWSPYFARLFPSLCLLLRDCVLKSPSPQSLPASHLTNIAITTTALTNRRHYHRPASLPPPSPSSSFPTSFHHRLFQLLMPITYQVSLPSLFPLPSTVVATLSSIPILNVSTTLNCSCHQHHPRHNLHHYHHCRYIKMKNDTFILFIYFFFSTLLFNHIYCFYLFYSIQ